MYNGLLENDQFWCSVYVQCGMVLCILTHNSCGHSFTLFVVKLNHF